MDLGRMFDDFFTTYSNLDPPPIKRKTDVSLNIEFSREDYNLYRPSTVEAIEDSKETYEIEQNPFSFEETKESDFTPQSKQSSEKITLKGPEAFELAFASAAQIDPSISKYKNFLVRIAKKESDFNSRVLNSAGAPYYGYFLMGKNEIAMTTKMSVEQFRNDPVAQILGACKLYEMNLKTIKKLGVYNLGKEKGYSDDALVAGAWLGGPGGVKKYLLGLGDPSDSHWYKNNKGGSSVGKYMNQFNK